MKRRLIANHIMTLLALVVLLALLTACSTTTESVPPAPEPQPESEFTQPEIEKAPTSAPSSISSQLKNVYFDFDRSEIRGDARPLLRANAEVLRRANADVVVEGHCDERGSEEYNLALGESRAHSVMKYLANLGVSSSRISIVSYGETRPEVRGHTETAWAKNRRVAFRGR
jgi:peptidoglycan-associated lipoprotein